MKRLILLAATAVISAGAYATSPYISLSYGGYNQMDVCDNHDGWGNVNTSWGSVNASVMIPVMANLEIGPSYSFSSTTTKGGAAHSSIAYHAILLNANYTYYRNPIVNVYSHVGIGAIISHMQPYGAPTFNVGYCGVQISPICAVVSLSRHFAIFGELGFGVQGTAQVGMRFSL